MNLVAQKATLTQEVSRMLNPVLNELQSRFSLKISSVFQYVEKVDLLSLNACVGDQMPKATNSREDRIKAYNELGPHITEIRNLPNPLEIFGPYMQGMNRIQLIGLWLWRTLKNCHIWLRKWINVTRIDLRIEERQ